MLKIHSIKVGESATNCYLIADEKYREAVIVDPGDAADYIERVIADKSLTPAVIILTHGHSDHTAAALELALAYKIPVRLAKEEVFLVKEMRSLFRGADFLKDKDKIPVGRANLSVIATPGHTPGSISLYSQTNKFIVSGDTCFADGSFGRTDFGYSNRDRLVQSLRRIKELPCTVTIFPGHGEPFRVEDLIIAKQGGAY